MIHVVKNTFQRVFMLWDFIEVSDKFEKTFKIVIRAVQCTIKYTYLCCTVHNIQHTYLCGTVQGIVYTL